MNSLRRFAFALAPLLCVPFVGAEDNLNYVSVEQVQALGYSIRVTHTGTSSDKHSGSLRTTDGRLDLAYETSGLDQFDNPWSTTATADLDSDYTLENDGQSLSFSGTASTVLTFVEDNPAPNIDGFWHSKSTWNEPAIPLLDGNKVVLEFKVDKFWTDYELNFEILSNTDASCRAYFLKQEYNASEGGYFFYVHENLSAINENLSSTGMLEEGFYQLIVIIRGNKNCDASVSYSLELTPNPDDPLILDPPPGGYTHPDIGDLRKDSEKLVVKNPVIVSETDLGDGTTELEVSAEVENTSTSKWSRAHLDIEFQVEEAPPLVSTTSVTFEFIEANETVSTTPDTNLKVVVANEHLETVKASILDTSRFTTDARELWSFNYPPVPYDFHESFTGSGDILTYDSYPPVSRGELLIALPDRYPVPPLVIDDTIPPQYSQSADKQMPFLVAGVTAPSPASLDTTHYLNGEQVDALDHMIDGTIVSSLPRIHPATGIDSTGPFGQAGPAYYPLPLHFNRIPISTDFELSGSFAVVPDDFRVELSMAAGEVKSLYAEGTLVVDVNFLLEAHAATDNSEASENDRTETLAEFPLFSIVLPSGLSFTPEFKLDVSALAAAEAGISVPITTGMKVVFRGGIVDGEPQYDCEVLPIPTRLTNPTIFSAANVTFQAEAETQLYFKFSKPEVPVTFGPTFSAALLGDFELDALADPAWTLGADLELRAGMEFQLAGIFDLVDVEKTLFTTPIFEKDSGAPLGGNPTVLAFNDGETAADNPGLKPIEGESSRWIRALRPNGSTSATRDLFVFPLPGTDRIIAGGGSVTNGEISCFDNEGGLVWMLNATYTRPIDAVPHADGTFTVLSANPFKIQLTRIDADGSTVWTKTYTASDPEEAHNYQSMALAYGYNPDGTPFYAVLSRASLKSPPFDRRPAIFAFDENGDPLWQKVYTPDENAGGGSTSTDPSEIIVTNDGHIAYLALTNADATGSAPGFDLSDAYPNLTYNGLVAKVSSLDASPLWASILPSKRIPELNALVQDPNGNYYAGGGLKLPVVDSIPSLWICKLDPAGVVVDSVLLGGPSDELPNGGQTLLDIVRDMVWADDALWIGGTMGFYNSGVGYFTGSHAFTGRLTADLGVSRFAIHAGPALDDITALADGTDGLIAFGTSKSFLPWPNGGASEAAPGDAHRLLMKLPWEGVTRFHSLSAGAHPEPTDDPPVQGTYYAQRVAIAGSDTDYLSVAQDTLAPGDDDTRTPGSPLGFTATDATLEESNPALAPSFQERLAYVALEAVPTNAIQDTDDFLAWNQINPESNDDDDPWNAAIEAFFGTDPFSFDAPGIQSFATLSSKNSTLTLVFPRAKIASDETLQLEVSTNLIDWTRVESHSQSESPLDDEADLITYTFDLPENTAFFRLVR
ncbi:hypothetical protein IEN85_08735 [Pelagicoccus sp. NFK12]|uniref:Uncharacterized protein n=1 Tax=Pelagicoccus enzymogenes TaxID=2773457 RepID=A0A927IH86_9BACT|nr:hypothetical protein [Pelagicoccus enzymogenes]MBD5779579.1 hypothetical protein [Pelagicoccus enzymogenes]